MNSASGQTSLYNYGRVRANPTCIAQQSRYGSCSTKTLPYGDLKYLFQCAPDAELDIKFHTGGHFEGFNSPNCQRYLVQSCANEWNEVCDAFAMNNNPSRFPITDPVKPIGKCDVRAVPLNRGQQFLRAVMSERYCDFKGYGSSHQLLNPLDPNSPMLTFKTPMSSYTEITCTPIDASDPMYNVCKRVGGCDDFLKRDA